MTCTIDATGLARKRETSAGLAILDLLLPEHYQASHIPGALNACVYEVVFLDTVRRLIPDKDAPIVVYDTSGRSQGSDCAVGKLEADGYRNICTLSGGLEGWIAAGLPLEPEGATVPGEPGLVDREYRIDTEKSLVVWTGRNLGSRHTGNLAISRGALSIVSGKLAGGKIVIDMKSLSKLDLQQALLKGWRPIPEATPGRPNYLIEADLTIKEITHPVQFPALVAPQADGIKAQATLDIDRTAWNIRYGSGRLFEKLGMHLVNDMVTLDFFLLAV